MVADGLKAVVADARFDEQNPRGALFLDWLAQNLLPDTCLANSLRLLRYELV